MMQLTCGRCGTQWNVQGSTAPPCPRCGAMAPVHPSQPPPGGPSTRSPMAATTERTAMGFSDPAAQQAASAHTLPAPTPAMLAPGSAIAGPQRHVPSYPAPPGASPPTPAYIPGPAPMPSHLPSYPMSAPQPPPAVQVVIHHQVMAPPTQLAPSYQTPYLEAPPYALAPSYERRKDAGIAALLSFFIPGAGQLYNGQLGKGAAFMLVMIFVNIPLMFVWIGFLTGLVTWLWAMIDAYASAERINRGQSV